MTREAEVKVLLLADPTVTAIVEDRIYTEGEIGIEGIRRGDDSPTNNAFDADGMILPSIFVREGSLIPYGNVRSLKDKFIALSQMVSLYFIEFRGSDQILLLKDRTCEILEGIRLGRSFPIWWVSETPPVPDTGPVANSTTLRQDWIVVSTRSSNAP